MMILRQDCGRIGRNGARDEAALAGSGPNADQLRMILWKPARGAKHGGDGGRRHGGFLEVEFARGGYAPKTHPKHFSGCQDRERKDAVGAKPPPGNLRVSFLRALRVCAAGRGERRASGLVPWVGGAYLISIRVWPLFSRCSPIFWGSAPSRAPSHDPSRDPSRKAERYVD